MLNLVWLMVRSTCILRGGMTKVHMYSAGGSEATDCWSEKGMVSAMAADNKVMHRVERDIRNWSHNFLEVPNEKLKMDSRHAPMRNRRGWTIR